jgi:hypothetical protein
MQEVEYRIYEPESRIYPEAGFRKENPEDRIQNPEWLSPG